VFGEKKNGEGEFEKRRVREQGEIGKNKTKGE
jgi:hypothetical protein